MNEVGAAPHGSDEGADAVFAELVLEITDKLQTGEAVDLELYVRRHPHQAARLRQLFPALQALVDLGVSSAEKVRTGAGMVLHADPADAALGDFRLLREIGRGGMGVVYEAEQVSLQRRVALKVLPFASVLRPTQLQRFENEIQIAAALDHSNIVRVFSVGCERGVHHFAMQLIEGQSLAEVIGDLRKVRTGQPADKETSAVAERETPGAGEPQPEGAQDEGLPDRSVESEETDRIARAYVTTMGSTSDAEFFGSVAQIGIQAAAALEHAHQKGVVHRDVKPSNLMVDGNGHLYVTDFGLARVQSETGLTMSGDVLGTLRYMSPEQAEGKRDALDHRSDIYSLGVTLYELLTLSPAFSAEDRHQLLRQVSERAPETPRQLNEAIPKDLETIVLKAMAREPEARYATAEELAEDLRRYLENEEIRAEPPSVARRGRKWFGRHRWVMLSAATLLVIAAAVPLHLLSSHLGGRSVFSIPFLKGPSSKSGIRDNSAGRDGRKMRNKLLEERRSLSGWWLQHAELTTGSGITTDDHAGQYVAIDGDTVAFSSHRDDTAADNAGAVYVYTRDDKGTPLDPKDDTWTQQAKLIAADPDVDDFFGGTVGIQGDTLWASSGDSNGGVDSGAVYVFSRSGTVWTQEAKLKASDASAGDRFGVSVSVCGELMAVGSFFDDDSGSVYVFVRDAQGVWKEQTKLRPDDATENMLFGDSVVVEDDTLVVGASEKDVGAGSAYVFRRNGTEWVQQAKLVANDGQAGDMFGDQVELDGATLVVKARWHDEARGAAYVYVRDDNDTPSNPLDDTWTGQAKLMASDAEPGDQVKSLAIEGDAIVIGSVNGDNGVADSGSVYIFERDDNGTPTDPSDDAWTERHEFSAADAESVHQFGVWVGILGGTVVAGDVSHDDEGEFSGGVFVFTYVPATSYTAYQNSTSVDLNDARNAARHGVSTSTINITDSGKVYDLNVGLDIKHSYDGQLTASLCAPDGARVELFNYVGGSGNNFTATVLDDSARTSVTESSAPFTGHFSPEGRLHTFKDRDAVGDWTLEIVDTIKGETGNLNSWSIELVTCQSTSHPQLMAADDEAHTDEDTAAPSHVLANDSDAGHGFAVRQFSSDVGQWRGATEAPEDIQTTTTREMTNVCHAEIERPMGASGP